MTPLAAQFTEWLKACNERFARFSGSQFSPHELPENGKRPLTAAKRLCGECRRAPVVGIRKYCTTCARTRKRESKRQHMRRKRGLDVEKVANSPTGAEALTKADSQARYNDPPTIKTASNVSTQKEAA